MLFLKEIPLRKTNAERAAHVDDLLGEDAIPSMPPLRAEDEPALAGSRR